MGLSPYYYNFHFSDPNCQVHFDHYSHFLYYCYYFYFPFSIYLFTYFMIVFIYMYFFILIINILIFFSQVLNFKYKHLFNYSIKTNSNFKTFYALLFCLLCFVLYHIHKDIHTDTILLYKLCVFIYFFKKDR